MAPYTPEDVEAAQAEAQQAKDEARDVMGFPRMPGAVRSDKGQSLLDRAAHATAERNKIAAELLAHAKLHLAESKRHEREATEATNTANILLGQKPAAPGFKPEEETAVVRFLFNAKREAITFTRVLALVALGISLIALGWALGNG